MHIHDIRHGCGATILSLLIVNFFIRHFIIGLRPCLKYKPYAIGFKRCITYVLLSMTTYYKKSWYAKKTLPNECSSTNNKIIDIFPRMITSNVITGFILCLMLCCLFFKVATFADSPDSLVSFSVCYLDSYFGWVNIERYCDNWWHSDRN